LTSQTAFVYAFHHKKETWINGGEDPTEDQQERTEQIACFFLSPATHNGEAGLAILCPFRNQIKGYTLKIISKACKRR